MHIWKKPQIQMILKWTAVIIWMLVIFLLSAQQGAESTNLSDRVAKIIIDKTDMLVHPIIDTSTFTFVKFVKVILRKSAHVAEYFILGILVINAVKASKVPDPRSFILSFLICILYAASDEIHQYFVPGREAQVLDVVIDSIGACVGIKLVPWIKKRNSTSCVE